MSRISRSEVKSQRLKVFVGLSGGVDSSVSAALLSARGGSPPDGRAGALGGKNPGYDVTGVFIRVWQPDFFDCGWKDDRLDAMRVCAKLGIPFVELDLEKEYKKEVVDYMIREYKAGKTPNPDVFCNRFIKFGGFYEYALAHGADYVATGHYARIGMRETPNHKHQITNKSQIPNPKLLTTNYLLLAGADSAKDQSYFLWQLRKEQLPHILFPVGGMKKSKVRALAKKFDLITADKKDSQGLCFVGKVDMKEFLSHYIKQKQGNIIDTRGNRIGKHSGAFFHTIGERLGISPRLNLKSGKRFNLGESRPLYVIAKDMAKNTLTVSPKTPSGDLPLARTEVAIKDCNWLMEPQVGRTYGARVRYRQPLQKARIMKYERGSMKYEVGSMNEPRKEFRTHNSKFTIQFASPQTVAAGQSLVLYDGDVLAGGGIITG